MVALIGNVPAGGADAPVSRCRCTVALPLAPAARLPSGTPAELFVATTFPLTTNPLAGTVVPGGTSKCKTALVTPDAACHFAVTSSTPPGATAFWGASTLLPEPPSTPVSASDTVPSGVTSSAATTTPVRMALKSPDVNVRSHLPGAGTATVRGSAEASAPVGI